MTTPMQASSSKTMRIDIPPADLEPTPGGPALEAPAAIEVPSQISHRDFQEFFQNVYDGALICTMDGFVVAANLRAEQLLGQTAEALVGVPVIRLISGGAPELLGTILHTLSEDRFVLLQANVMRAGEGPFPAEIAAHFLSFSSTGYLSFFIRDVTLRKEAEAQSRTEFIALQNAGDGIAITDLEGRLQYANPAFLRLWALNKDGVIGHPPIVSLFRKPQAAEAMMKSVRAGTPWFGEMEAERHNGSVFFSHLSVSPNINEDDEMIGMVFACRDVSQSKSDQQKLERYRDHLEDLVKERTRELTRANRKLEKEVHERIQAEEASKNARHYVETVIATSQDGIFVIDAEGLFEYGNEAFINILGWPREDLMRQPFMKVIPEDKHAFILERWQEVQRGEGHPYETDILTSQGERRTLLVSHKDMVIGGEPKFCVMVSDITERKKVEVDLLRAIARLKEHDKAKTQFVSNVSHELRTPLTSIGYAVENMLGGVVGPLPDRARSYVEMLKEDCQRLSRTISDILDLSRIERNALVLSLLRVPFSRFAQRTAESLRVQAEAKGITFTVKALPGSGFVECDIKKMERVILNIVNNAIKFTPEDGRISVELLRDQSAPGVLRLDICDSGIGIPAEHIGRVTERYYRIGEHVGGTGLGLAIAREIVELHGGKIALSSPPPGWETGTAVALELPVVESPTLLVVDDEKAVLLTTEHMLSEGYRVRTCDAGRQALQMMRNEPPAMVLLDMVLGDMDGPEVLMHMKADHQLRNIPVLAMSGRPLDGPKQGILDGFGVSLIEKPWHVDDMLDRIEEAFMNSEAPASPVPLQD